MVPEHKRERRSRKAHVDLLVLNAEELVSLRSNYEKPRTGGQMSDLAIIRKGGIAAKDGRIVAVDTTSELKRQFKASNTINAAGRTVLPGFVDPHTHLVFEGSRENEFEMRVQGVPYMKILEAGGGILKTVKATRRASIDRLLDRASKTMDIMLEHGTTTVEAKSGYGLTLEDEEKILSAAKRLDQLHAIDVVSTFMGAHAVPPEYTSNPENYVDLIINDMIPTFAAESLAEFCDVFCEKGAFGLNQSKRILTAGRNHGLKIKIHADEISNLGGAELASDLGATSAEHLLHTSDDGIRSLARRGVIAVLLPAASFCLMTEPHANARKMINGGVPVALGTDFNPSCWIESQQLVIAFACRFLGLTPAEAITAATINAAYAVDRAGDVGSLDIGKKADILVMNAPSYRFLGYRFGSNLVQKVVKGGKLVFDGEKPTSAPPFD